MSKLLPYFRWFVADAETDERYGAMTNEEVGVYHRCLNKAWVNVGLPADLEQVRALLHLSKREFDRVWPAVSACFTLESGRLFNRRQEEERSYALAKSASATESVRSRYERRTNDLPRASESVSVFVSGSVLYEGNKEAEFQLSADPPSAVRSVVPAGPTFEDWWKVWWNKTAKAETQKAWPQIAKRFGVEFLIEQCIADRKRFEGTPSWEWRANLHPGTWLRGRRWEDQLPPEVAPRLANGSRPASTGERVLAKMAQRIANGENPL